MAMKQLAATLLLLAIASSTLAAPCTTNWANTLFPCLQATNNAGVTPSAQCCNSLISAYLNRRDAPTCLCNDMLTAHSAISFNVQNALSIPSRCGYGNRVPQHFKCGNYEVGH